MACAVPAGHAHRAALRTRDAFGWREGVRHSAAASGYRRMSQDQALAADMAAAQAGDAEAYRRLLRDCLPVIAGMARAQGVRAEAVDDVVQDVLLTIHRARATYDPARPFLPWLRAITQRRAIDGMRRAGRRPREVHDPIAYEAEADRRAGAGPRPGGARPGSASSRGPSPPCRKGSARRWSISPCGSAASTRRPPSRGAARAPSRSTCTGR